MREMMKRLRHWIEGKLGGARERSRDLGSYRLVERLGEGGMGEVWRGEHRLLGRQAAIKIMKPEVLKGVPARRRDEWLRRFEREARATALLQSPHTVRLFDLGLTAEGTLYYAMELLEGVDLETLVERFGPIGPARTVFLLDQICASLAEAHEAGLVHRDVKPANIFLSRLGLEHDFVKVLDFGLVTGATRDGRGEGRITEVNEIVGTPSFMAPELVEGRRAIDARADIYAVGCVAYWLLTGTHVFQSAGRTPIQVMLDHACTPPERPSVRLGRPIPAALESLVMSCLEKDPEKRPRSGVELARCLKACPVGQSWAETEARGWWSAHLPELAGPRLRSEGYATTLVRQRVLAA